MNTYNRFDLLVGEQLETMDKLVSLQSKIEHYQQMELEFLRQNDDKKLRSVQKEIEKMKNELIDIQKTFEKQTEEVIKMYQIEMYDSSQPF
ncbi:MULTISPECIES: YgaB family protein [Aeribacillus]|nr:MULTISPECIES: YgaB family protein [Aeribacillus]MDR9792652.1 YgaB family protein [Aeribacillus pallidus]MDR9797042.1 YgaB family protein [Aeribacillus pallidus]MED0652006.1 YgaB family protein [Aeribacillus composti]MED0701662.1 YgaB family protein [Aeribacillus composti]MED0715650.1 YgaB family protein [Aeribacillus composti]